MASQWPFLLPDGTTAAGRLVWGRPAAEGICHVDTAASSSHACVGATRKEHLMEGGGGVGTDFRQTKKVPFHLSSSPWST